MKSPVHVIAYRGGIYGWSRKLADAVAALDRGRQRGVTWGVISTLTNPPRGFRSNDWMTPFDDRKAGFR